MRDESRHMRPRAYVLLDVTPGKADWVARTLRSQSGVFLADEIEDPPCVVVVLEATERQKLAESAVRALYAVEAATDGVRLLPAKDTVPICPDDKVCPAAEEAAVDGPCGQQTLETFCSSADLHLVQLMLMKDRIRAS